MCKRTGLGIHVQELWVQKALKDKRFNFKPIAGVGNPADILTKYVDRVTLETHCPKIQHEGMSGRSIIAPEIN
jgi:hypothetical protein